MATAPQPFSTASVKIVPDDIVTPTTAANRLNRRFGLLDAGVAINQSDIFALQQAIAGLSVSSGPEGVKVLQDTHANRLANFPATSYSPGDFFIETDRTVVYVCLFDSVHGTNQNQWWYRAGKMRAAMATHPTDLTFFDDGFEFWTTDYMHIHVWSGTGAIFEYGDSDLPGRWMPFSGPSPSGPAWYPCDGSTVTVSKGDCTTGTIVTPNINNADIHGNYPFLMGGGVGLLGPAADTFVTGARTDVDSQTPQNVQSGTGATVPAEPHSHPLSSAAGLNQPGETSGAGGTPSGLGSRYGATFFMRG